MVRRLETKNLDLAHTVISVSRVSKVTKGGRRFAFKVLVVVGDGKGNIGFASAKHTEMGEARNKATKKAKNNLVQIPMRRGHTIHHSIEYKYGASKLFLKPALEGTGIIAGGAVRKFCEIAGITDIIAKIYGSSNEHNLINAMFHVFKNIYAPRYILNKRGRRHF